VSSRVDGSFRYDGPWRKVRLAILERDGWECQLRLEGCTGWASEVDHVVAVSLGGGVYDPENLRAACATCNRRRGGVLGGSKPFERRPSREW
jgi:5-methylcytosine-specific restriction endonuclease McrA